MIKGLLIFVFLCMNAHAMDKKDLEFNEKLKFYSTGLHESGSINSIEYGFLEIQSLEIDYLGKKITKKEFCDQVSEKFGTMKETLLKAFKLGGWKHGTVIHAQTLITQKYKFKQMCSGKEINYKVVI